MNKGDKVRINEKAGKEYRGLTGTIDGNPYINLMSHPTELIFPVHLHRDGFVHNLFAYKLDIAK